MSTNTEQTATTERAEPQGPGADMVAEWAALLAELQGRIKDEYRCTRWDDTKPGMLVTFGFTPATDEREACWAYQTGDNSFSGGAYGHRFWGVAYLLRDSDCATLAQGAADEIWEQLAS